MQFINIKDYKTGDIIKALNFGNTIKALNFGEPKCYKVSGKHIWAPEGGTSLVISENNITLNPLGLVINNPNIWTVVSHQNIGTANWRITVKNLATNEEKSGVYPFNLSGNVYELECQPGTWVMASCGGYKIESSWGGQQSYELYRLKGTGEIIRCLGVEILNIQSMAGPCTLRLDYDVYSYRVTLLSDIGIADISMLQQQLYSEFRSRFSTSTLRMHSYRSISVKIDYISGREVFSVTYYVPTTYIGYDLLGGRYASDQEVLDTICFYINNYHGKNISIAIGEPYNAYKYYCPNGERYTSAYNLSGSIMYI